MIDLVFRNEKPLLPLLFVNTLRKIYEDEMYLQQMKQFVLVMLMSSLLVMSAVAQTPVSGGNYKINPGDILSLNVWNEPTMSAAEILVRPDGYISVPVVGEELAGGLTVTQLQENIATSFNQFLKEKPSIVISILRTTGSQIFVLGKVSRPGPFPLIGAMDVTQALSYAGGITTFAAENKIKVLRRAADGSQTVMKFKYGDVKEGRLGTNILLKSGDVVLVP